MSHFNSLKTSSSLDNLKAAIEKASGKTTFKDDERFWQPTMDKSGNSFSLIRFLPEPKDADGPDAVALVKVLSHSYKTDIGWYINLCPTLIGDPCPVCEANSLLWNTGIDANKKIVRDRRRVTKYISNIYIINDPAHPENNGKIKLYRYPTKVLDRINLAICPQFADEIPFNPFNLWTGANFKLKIRIVDKQWNYDLCSFESPSPLFTDEDKLRQIFESEYSLKEHVDPSLFKSYDQLKKRFDLVSGNSSAPSPHAEDVEHSISKNFEKSEEVTNDVPFDDDDPDLNYFKSLID